VSTDYQTNLKFRKIGAPDRLWAVPAIHSETQRLLKIHDSILERFVPGDRIIYLGNYTGYNKYAVETVDELLAFRRLVLCHTGAHPDDLTYLRGAQEEIWQKLLQLPFAPNPKDVLVWMLGNGLHATLQSYGICAHDGIDACSKGIMGITKWINDIRTAVRAHPGHDILRSHMVRAAFTDEQSAHPLLFVHAGLDDSCSLLDQGDALWWAPEKFTEICRPYDPFKKVIRGYDPTRKGVEINGVTATLDAGCGFGGRLICAGFEPNGSVFEMLEA